MLPVVVAVLGGCGVVGGYPRGWPEDAGERIGKCPAFAGTYENAGVVHPPAAMPLSLTQVLGLPHGDRVVIEQARDSITVSVWKSDVAVETVVFESGEVRWRGLTGWDTTRPRTLSRPLSVAAFKRRLSFSPLMQSSVGGVGGMGAGVVAASGESVWFTKRTDGSLLLRFDESWGALIGIIPVGCSRQFWIRFAPAR